MTSRPVRKYRLIFLVILGLLLLIGGLHTYDRQKTTRNEFDSAAIQAISESRVQSILEANSIVEMNELLAKCEREAAQRLSVRGASIKKDQSKIVRWAGGEFQTPLSLVYIHGFSASRLELEPVISNLAEKLRANVFFTRLSAHGLSDGEEFENVRARDWAVEVDEAIAIGQKIGQRVILIGMSTGAALVLDGYDRSPVSSRSSIGGVILLSPNYALKDFGGFLLEGSMGRELAHQILGTHRKFPVENALHGERWTTNYRTAGLTAMMTAVSRVQQIDFSQWEAPILTLYSTKDDVVSAVEIESVSRRFPKHSTLINWSPATRHQLASATFNAEAIPALTDLLFDWIRKNTE